MFRRRFYNLPRETPYWVVLLFWFLLFWFHLLLIYALPHLKLAEHKDKKIKVHLVHEVKTNTDPAKEQKQEKQHEIIEAEQPETLKPKDPDFIGQRDHQTPHEVKVAHPRQNAEDPTNTTAEHIAQALKNHPPQSENLPPKLDPKKGQSTRPVPKDFYKRFMPTLAEIGGKTGHQDFVEKHLDNGQILDVNTTEYKWIGYFTNVRKTVAQAFFSPYAQLSRSKEVQERLREKGSAAMRGKAVVAVTITRSGLLTEARLIQSSGDKEVDDFWVNILNIAAPFPPLPKHYEEETLTFQYALTYDFEWQRRSAFDSAAREVP